MRHLKVYDRKTIIAIAEDENTNPKNLYGDSRTFAMLTGLKDTTIQNAARLGRRVQISGVYYYLEYLAEYKDAYLVITGTKAQIERIKKNAELEDKTVEDYVLHKCDVFWVR